MSSTFSQRYTYGNFSDIPLFSPEADFFYGVPARQQELVSLAKAQLAAQKQAAQEIAASNIAAGALICRELRSQTEQLQASINEGADRIVDAIDNLGNRVAGELSEIRWELAQQRAVSEQMLDVLKRPRSTQVQELVQQGVRNLVYDKLDYAVHYFEQALELDNTDYRVLMNLSAVALRKDDPQQAIDYVKDALTLPSHLDNAAKADALWHLARIHYTLAQYGEALGFAQQSTKLLSTPRRIFQLGVYSILAGQVANGFALIGLSIRSDPGLFAVAASSPDLFSHRPEVLAMLEALATGTVEELRQGIDRIEADLKALNKFSGVPQAERCQYFLRFFKDLAQAPTYSGCRLGLVQLTVLSQVPRQLQNLTQIRYELRSSLEAEASTSQEYERAWRRVERFPKRPGCIAAFVGSVALLALAYFLMTDTGLREIPVAGKPILSPESIAGAVFLYGIPLLLGLLVKIFIERSEYRSRELASSLDCQLTQIRTAVEAGRREVAAIETRANELLATIRIKPVA